MSYTHELYFYHALVYGHMTEREILENENYVWYLFEDVWYLYEECTFKS